MPVTCTSSSSRLLPARGVTLAPRRAARRAAALLALLLLLGAALPARADEEEPKPLREEETGLLSAVDAADQSVVTVVGFPMRYGPPRPGHKLKRLIGTAIVSSEHRLITTASMALPGGTLSVLLGKGVEREARLLGVDRKSNLALFEVEGARLTALRRASPRSLAVGSWVAVLSNVSITRPQAALGRVAGRGERIDFPYAGDIVEIEAPSYLGATGAAVLNEEGDWVAVVVGRAAPAPSGPSPEEYSPPGPASSREPAAQPNSVLLALPVDQVDRIVSDLAEHGSVRQAFLGVGLRVDPNDSLGVRVVRVAPGSPAENAGIQVGDRILAIEGSEMRTSEEITEAVRGMRPGDDVALTIVREAEILPVRATLVVAPADGSGSGAAREAEIRALRENLERLRDESRRLEDRLKSLEAPRR